MIGIWIILEYIVTERIRFIGEDWRWKPVIRQLAKTTKKQYKEKKRRMKRGFEKVSFISLFRGARFFSAREGLLGVTFFAGFFYCSDFQLCVSLPINTSFHHNLIFTLLLFSFFKLTLFLTLSYHLKMKVRNRKEKKDRQVINSLLILSIPRGLHPYSRMIRQYLPHLIEMIRIG